MGEWVRIWANGRMGKNTGEWVSTSRRQQPPRTETCILPWLSCSWSKLPLILNPLSSPWWWWWWWPWGGSSALVAVFLHRPYLPPIPPQIPCNSVSSLLIPVGVSVSDPFNTSISSSSQSSERELVSIPLLINWSKGDQADVLSLLHVRVSALVF